MKDSKLKSILQNEYILAGMVMLICLVALFPGYFFLGQSLSTTGNINMNYPWRSINPNFRPQYVYDPTARLFSWPQEIMSYNQIKNGIPPLWNPYIANGTPLLITMQLAPFYPLKLLYYLLPFWWAADIIWLLRIWLGGMGAYFLARTLNIKQWGSLLAGITYLMSSTQLLVFSMPIPNVTITFPWILAISEKIIKDKSLVTHLIGLNSLFIGSQFLGGWPESSVHLVLAVAIYSIVRSLQLYSISILTGRAVTWVAISGILGLALSSVQLLPFGVDFSQIYNAPHDLPVQDFIPLQYLTSLGVPLFIGINGKSWVPGDIVVPEAMLFVSSPVIILALAALWQPQLRRQLMGLIVVSTGWLWYSFHLPLSSLLATLPLIKIISVSWGLFVPITCLAILAGSMLDYYFINYEKSLTHLMIATGLWLVTLVIYFSINITYVSHITIPVKFISDKFETMWSTFFVIQHIITLIVILIFLGLLYLYKRMAFLRTYIPIMILLLVGGQLWYAGVLLNRSSSTYGYSTTPGIEFLKSDKDLFRISGVGRKSISLDNAPLMAQSASMFGLYDSRNHDAIMSYRFLQFTSVAEYKHIKMPAYEPAAFGLSNPESKKFLDMTNVKYLLDFPSQDWPNDKINQELIATGWELVWDKDMRVYRNPTVLPRAYVTHEAQTVPIGESLAPLANPNFDPRRTTIIEGDLPFTLTGGSTAIAKPVITRYEPLQVEVEVEMDQHGMLVLADSWFPEWRAELDGNSTTLYIANHNFRAVYVPKGKHTVLFWYDTTIFWVSSFISVISLIISTGMIIINTLTAPIYNKTNSKLQF